MSITNYTWNPFGSGGLSPRALHISWLVESIKNQDLNQVEVFIKAGVHLNEKETYPTILDYAINSGNDEITERLIRAGVNLDSRGREPGMSPLQIAVRENRNHIAKLMIEYGAELNHVDFFGNSNIFFFSMYYENDEITEFLINKKFNLDEEDWSFPKEKPIHLAVQRRKTNIARLLIENGAGFNPSDVFFFNELMDSIKSGHNDMAKFLIENGVSIEFRNSQQETVLHNAVNAGNLEMVMFLVERGADVNAVNSKFQTPLIEAIYKGEDEIAVIMIKHFCEKQGREWNPGGNNPLCAAVHMENIEILQLLIDNMRDGGDICYNGYQTPLFWAIYLHKVECAKMIIDRGLFLHLCNPRDGATPLHLAVYCRDLDVATKLLDKGAPLDSKDKEGKTPLYNAVVSGNIHGVKFLLEKGARFLDKPSSYLKKVVNPFLIELAKFKGEHVRKFIAGNMFAIQTDEERKSPLSFVEKTIEQAVSKAFRERLKEKNHEGLQELYSQKRSLLKEIKKRKDNIAELKKTGQKIPLEQEVELEQLINLKSIKDAEMAPMKENIQSVRELHRNAMKLKKEAEKITSGESLATKEKREIAEREIRNVEELLQIRLNINCPALIYSYLIGMIGNDFDEHTVKSIISFFYENIEFKDKFKNEKILSWLQELVKMNTLSESEKIGVLKRVSDEFDEKRNEILGRDLPKEDCKKQLKKLLEGSLKKLSFINVLAKFERGDLLKGFIHTEECLFSYLKNFVGNLFQSEFNLQGVQDVGNKYLATFGNPLKFRDSEAIFLYLSSIRKYYLEEEEYEEEKEALDLLSTYVEDVLEGRFLDERYNLDKSIHLKTIFSNPFRSSLLEKWKSGETLPALKIIKDSKRKSTGIDYTQFFKEKIVTDKHLGVNWRELYPALSRAFNNHDDIQNCLNEIAVRIAAGEDSDESFKILEAQRQILVLCQNREFSQKEQREYLMNAQRLFVGKVLANDLKALLVGLSLSESRVDKLEEHTIGDSDDACDFLLMGREIFGSCQDVGSDGGHNMGLLGPLLDGKYRIIVLKNRKGKIVARCLLKILWDMEKRVPVLFQERLYVNDVGNHQHAELLNEMCLRKAQAMNLPLLKIFNEEVNRYPNIICSLGGRSTFEYVDALTGLENNNYDIALSTVIWQPER
jgi:ankyrin repeat protein